MPKFFFHIRQDGELIEDPDGTVLASLEAAVASASQDARAIVAERIAAGNIVKANSIEVTDPGGVTLAVVTFQQVLEALTPHFGRRDSASRTGA